MTAKSDLVSFGNSLLTDRGEGKHIVSNKLVTNAEIENWKHSKTEKK